ncbi:hypothetical protein AB0D45_05740 [Streptomyces sp. NPDC048352]|uniref:hypothetical protein n=1 Tax=Streptomyces sp. NPDC048352 TaxID=3154718 RepID=UPI00343E9773
MSTVHDPTGLRAHLLTTAARTAPDGFLPHVPGEENSPFDPMLPPNRTAQDPTPR